MATFEAKVYKLTIEEHPNADALELAIVGGYRSIVPKGKFKTGDLGVYIPEAAVLPEWLIKNLGLEGKLAGKDKNRVKAVKLRGILSQGLVYPVYVDGISGDHYVAGEQECDREFVQEGSDVTEFIGITKYEPPIPVQMAGEVFNAHGYTLNYDIENLKKYPDIIEENEQVILTEKIHGTWVCFGFHPDVPLPLVTSKGLSSKGLVFKLNEANVNNLYLRMFDKLTGNDEVPFTHRAASEMFLMGLVDENTPCYILGEIYGKGIQDVGWYNPTDQDFRVFDIYIGQPGHGRYLNYIEMKTVCARLNLELVPTLYIGPYSDEIIDHYTNGNETVSGQGLNMREGIVITPWIERKDAELGRVKLKSVSEAYLMRKNGTEYN